MDIDNTILVRFVSQNEEMESVDPVKLYYLWFIFFVQYCDICWLEFFDSRVDPISNCIL